MKSLINAKHGWSTIELDEVTLSVAGQLPAAKEIAQLLINNAPYAEISKRLLATANCFACIIEHNDFIFAATDRIRSYPIFYNNEVVSNSAIALKADQHISTINHEALQLFSMMGFTPGNETLFETIKQLRAGEFCLLKNNSVETKRYYEYLPNPNQVASQQRLIEQHATVLNNAINRTIEKANGRTIVLPLSGGLDSRILLAKLVEKKYDRIQTVSYGIKGNFEAKRAKHVANQLNIPWQFIPARPNSAKKLFASKQRFEFSKEISELHTTPSYLEFEAFHYLTENKIIPAESFIVNGQTGDFISGGHCPEILIKKAAPTFDDFLNAIINKHASLWLNLLTDENRQRIKNSILTTLPDLDLTETNPIYWLSQYERWEWQERQCKIVVSGQRLYDFFGLDWDLPLWDAELMDFWAGVPYPLKFNQKLYINYLQAYYPSLFSDLRPKPDPWVKQFKWIPFTAKIYGLIAGKKRKQHYYKRMYYYGTDYNQYALVGRAFYLAHYKNIRNVVSLFAKTTLDELGINDTMTNQEAP